MTRNSYSIKAPHPDTFVAEAPEFDAKLYAMLADCPLYVNARIITGRPLFNKRRSFHLGWVIEDQRPARGKDAHLLPGDLLLWVCGALAQAYPNLESATGMSPAELAELKAEQAAKRARYKKA
jgi:hypothetical protein